MIEDRQGSISSTGLELDEITGIIIEEALKIHRDIGAGLLGSVYEAVLSRALERRGLHVLRQVVVEFQYDGMTFDDGLRIDLLVERRVVVELKSVEALAPLHSKQVLTYLRLTGLQVGLLINFGGSTLKQGLKRIVNDLRPSESPLLRVNRFSGSLGASSESDQEPHTERADRTVKATLSRRILSAPPRHRARFPIVEAMGSSRKRLTL